MQLQGTGVKSFHVTFPQDLAILVYQQAEILEEKLATLDKQIDLIQQLRDEAGVSLTFNEDLL